MLVFDQFSCREPAGVGFQNSLKNLMAASRKRPRSMVKLSSTRLFRAAFLSALLAILTWAGKVEARGGGSHKSLFCIARRNNIRREDEL